jgi:hypothetical protein
MVDVPSRETTIGRRDAHHGSIFSQKKHTEYGIPDGKRNISKR